MLSVKSFLFIIILMITCVGHAVSPYKAEKSLLITDLSVMNSEEANIYWPFPRLMQRLHLNSVSNAEFILNWMKQWESVSSINSRPVLPLDYRHLLRFWPTVNGKINFDRSPFLLSAIIYRPDLADAHSGGEFRLVYTGFDERIQIPLQFTLIAEFKIPKLLESSVKNIFIGLSKIEFGKKFNRKLNQIFEIIATPENLGQLRSNDFIMNDVWDLREFHLKNGQLVMSPTAFTPILDLNPSDTAKLLNEIISHKETILNGTYKLPKELWGGMAKVPSEKFIWFENQPLNPELRTAFSKFTCNGCHAGATNSRFVHLAPRMIHEESESSEYLKGELQERLKYLEDFGLYRHPYTH